MTGSYFTEWAREMKKILSRAVIGTSGGWRESHRMAEAVETYAVDMVGLGRPLRDDPTFPSKLLRKEGNSIRLYKL